MLRFTPEQSKFIANARRQHEKQHEAMRANYGSQLLMGNANSLPKDVWGLWDTEGIAIQRDVLAVFADLAASVSKGMPLGKILHYFQQVSDSSEAHISIDGRSKAKNDAPEFTYVGTPLPIVDSSFGFGWRDMLAAQTEGVSLDSGARVNAVRKVAEKLENIALVGDTSIVVAGNALYGLTNHPQRNTRSTGATLNGTTGANWMAEVLATVKLVQGDNYIGRPITLYLNWADWFYASTTDYYTSGLSSKTILQRITEIAGLAGIVPSSKVTANTIIAVVKAQDVVQVLNGMPVSTRAQARMNPEDDYNFVVMAAAAVELKYDASGNMGLAHSS